MNGLCEACDLVDHMLATVEDQKQAAAAQKADDTAGRIGMMNDETQRGGERADDERRIPQGTEVEKMDAALERLPHLVRQRDRDGGLADAARTSERDEALAEQARRKL